MEVACTWDRVIPVYEAVRKAVAPLAFVLCHFSHAYLEGCSLYFSFVGSAGTDVDQEVRYRELWRACARGGGRGGRERQPPPRGRAAQGRGAARVARRGEAAAPRAQGGVRSGRDHEPGEARVSAHGKLKAALDAARPGGARGAGDRARDRARAVTRRSGCSPSTAASFGPRIRLSREAFTAIGEVDGKSAVISAEAGVRLAELERRANAHDLSLGPLPPGAEALTVAEFLEGPHAGLRVCLGGRLEPIALAVRGAAPRRGRARHPPQPALARRGRI